MRAIPGDRIHTRLLLVLALAAGLVVGAPTVGLAGHDFDDVPDDHPFHDEISWLVEQGITDGYGDGTFKPGADVSRQAAAAFLFRFAGKPAGEWTSDFDDVPADHPFYEEISWLVEAGVTDGYGDGTFKPGADVSRQAAAAFLFRLAGEPEGPYANDFDDVPEGHPFHDAISWLAEQGVTGGYEDGTFRPGHGVARQAAAAFLFHADGRLGSMAGEVREPGFLAADGDPIEGASVWIDETSHDTVTDAEGAYTLAHVPPGEYTVNAYADGYEQGSQTVTIEPGEDATGVDFELEPFEEPAPAVAITDPTTEQPATAPVGHDLDVAFETNRSGEYVLELRAADDDGAWLEFGGESRDTVSRGEHTATVRVPAGAVNEEVYDLRATFTAPEEDPVEHVQARALLTGEGAVVNVTQEEAFFDLAAADAAAATDDTLQVFGTLNVSGLDLATDGLSVDGLDEATLNFVDGRIYLDGDGQTITGLRFEGYQIALGSDDHLTAGRAPTITGNVFAGGGTAVLLEDSNAATVTGNAFEATTLGVATADEDADISGNTFDDNALGVRLDAQGLATTVADNAFGAGNDAHLCDATSTHDLSSDGDLATANDFGDDPPVAFDDCLRPDLDGSWVHNLDSYVAHRGLQASVDAAGSGETLEAHGTFAEQVDIDVADLTLQGGDATLDNPGTSAEPIVTVSADGVTVADATLTGGALALPGANDEGVLSATLTGNTVSGAGGHGIDVTVGETGTGGVPGIGEGASLVIEDNTVTGAGAEDIRLTLVPQELNGQEPADGREAAVILFDDNAGLATAEVPEGETYRRER